MNSFANSLFLLLFGGVRTLIQQIWDAVASGWYNGFLSWLGDHWMWLAAIICLACTVVDFAVWLIRWRPYLVWRTAFRKLGRLFSPEKYTNERRFRRGYQGGVGLEISQEPEPVPQTDWEDEALREAQPEAGHTFTQLVAQASIPLPWQTIQPVTVPPGGEENQDDSSGGDSRQRHFAPPAYEAPPLYVSSRLNASGADMSVARRRRRSEKYEKRRGEWREKLIKGDEEEDRLLDGLPPAVDRQQAFHAPVLPRSGNYTGWQRPAADNQQTDGQQ